MTPREYKDYIDDVLKELKTQREKALQQPPNNRAAALEKAKTDAGVKELLSVTNYLVDGKFEKDKKTLDWFYRGSSNQRIFDITCYPNSTKARLIERLEDLK